MDFRLWAATPIPLEGGTENTDKIEVNHRLPLSFTDRSTEVNFVEIRKKSVLFRVLRGKLYKLLTLWTFDYGSHPHPPGRGHRKHMNFRL
jgi:hypothetical protein